MATFQPGKIPAARREIIHKPVAGSGERWRCQSSRSRDRMADQRVPQGSRRELPKKRLDSLVGGEGGKERSFDEYLWK